MRKPRNISTGIFALLLAASVGVVAPSPTQAQGVGVHECPNGLIVYNPANCDTQYDEASVPPQQTYTDPSGAGAASRSSQDTQYAPSSYAGEAVGNITQTEPGQPDPAAPASDESATPEPPEETEKDKLLRQLLELLDRGF